jgi:hypothetical protein
MSIHNNERFSENDDVSMSSKNELGNLKTLF